MQDKPAHATGGWIRGDVSMTPLNIIREQLERAERLRKAQAHAVRGNSSPTKTLVYRGISYQAK